MSASIQITLDPVALREATAQAIMGTLTPEMRTQIISKAISAVLQPSTDSWNRGKSPLQDAFEMAVVDLARQEAKKYITESPEVSAQLQQLLRKVADRVLSADQDKMAQKMADAFISSIKKDDY